MHLFLCYLYMIYLLFKNQCAIEKFSSFSCILTHLVYSYLRTGDGTKWCELFPQFLIINGVIQILDVKVYSLKQSMVVFKGGWSFVSADI